MQPVRRLVGVDADQRRPRAVDRAVEALERDVGEHVREAVAERRVEPAPELERPADDVLPETALRLVQRGRAAGRERAPVERGVAAVLVEAVADLVHRREDRGAVQVVLGVARREANVLRRERDAERMDGRVEPERPLVRAERPCDDERQLVLHVDRVRAGEERPPAPPAGSARRAHGARGVDGRRRGAPRSSAFPPRSRRAGGRTGRPSAGSRRRTRASARGCGRATAGRPRSRRSRAPSPTPRPPRTRASSSRRGARPGCAVPSPSRASSRRRGRRRPSRDRARRRPVRRVRAARRSRRGRRARARAG